MKVFIVLSLFCIAATYADDYCFQDVVGACTKTASKHYSPTTLNCTAKFGAIDHVQPSLQKFANHHLIRSFEYLLMSTHFANYQKNRAGFEKLFRDLSDNKWHEGIEMIKYLTKRGGEMNFLAIGDDVSKEEERERSFELYELSAVARALDIEKNMAAEAFTIHTEASRKDSHFHDPEISDYIEKEFAHKERDIIRKLAGYSTDLSGLLNKQDSSLSLYLFDEYLQKQ